MSAGVLYTDMWIRDTDDAKSHTNSAKLFFNAPQPPPDVCILLGSGWFQVSVAIETCWVRNVSWQNVTKNKSYNQQLLVTSRRLTVALLRWTYSSPLVWTRLTSEQQNFQSSGRPWQIYWQQRVSLLVLVIWGKHTSIFTVRCSLKT